MSARGILPVERQYNAVLADRIRVLLNERKITHTWAAAQLGILRSTFSSALSGRRNAFTPYELAGLAAALEMSVEELLPKRTRAAADDAPVRTVAGLLVDHQRHQGGCLCGWSELGRSHPEHQVSVLRAAGLLTDGEKP